MVSDYDLDHKNKLGGDVQWEDGDDFATFVDALNRGVSVRPDGVSGVDDLPRENQLDADAVGKLRSLLANYR